MSHDVQAAWATTQVASDIRKSPRRCFSTPPPAASLSVFALQDSRRDWPVCDGVVRVEQTSGSSYEVALEFKGKAEGLHGVLTALGQAHAYLDRGFSASVLVLPCSYDSHADPGGHVTRIIDATSADLPIGVISYSEPDVEETLPFDGKFDYKRDFLLDTQHAQPSGAVPRRVQTQWGHVREGSTDPHALFVYLQTAKRLVIDGGAARGVRLPRPLREACRWLRRNTDPLLYLSNTTSDSLHDRVWQHFWFANVFHQEAIPIWARGAAQRYVVNAEPSLLLKPGGSRKSFFVGRTDSVKNRLVEELNNGSMTEAEAWREYAENVRARAHSYREDIDSGLDALGLLERDGKPTDLGYRFVDACERSRNWETGIPRALLGAALLKNASFAALLHYIYRLSEKKFSEDPHSFAGQNTAGRWQFEQSAYRSWLEQQLADELCVMRKVSPRGGQARQPFQAELRVLRLFEFVRGFRLGVGLEINWPAVQEALGFAL